MKLSHTPGCWTWSPPGAPRRAMVAMPLWLYRCAHTCWSLCFPQELSKPAELAALWAVMEACFGVVARWLLLLGTFEPQGSKAMNAWGVQLTNLRLFQFHYFIVLWFYPLLQAYCTRKTPVPMFKISCQPFPFSLVTCSMGKQPLLSGACLGLWEFHVDSFPFTWVFSTHEPFAFCTTCYDKTRTTYPSGIWRDLGVDICHS